MIFLKAKTATYDHPCVSFEAYGDRPLTAGLAWAVKFLDCFPHPGKRFRFPSVPGVGTPGRTTPPRRETDPRGQCPHTRVSGAALGRQRVPWARPSLCAFLWPRDRNARWEVTMHKRATRGSRCAENSQPGLLPGSPASLTASAVLITSLGLSFLRNSPYPLLW